MPADREPAAEAVRDALKRVLASAEFARSERMSHLLTFLVEETLAGRAAGIKGYTVGVEVFGKGEDFDPEQDAIVRVQAGRLRKMLQTYRLTEGKDDPVVIDVPTGGYVPVFLTNERKTSETKPVKSGRAFRPGRGLVAVASVVLTCVAIIGAGIFMQKSGITLFPEDGDEAPALKKSSLLPDGPSIAVLPFADMAGQKTHSYLKTGLAHEIIADLSRFKDLSVLGASTTKGSPGLVREPLVAGQKLGVRYVVSGTVAEDEKHIHTSAQLLEVATGRVIWSKVFKKDKSGQNVFDIQSKISASVAAALGQPYGIINRLESRRIAGKNILSHSAYECYLRFFEYAQRETEKTHLDVRGCLEKAVKETPEFAGAWAALSWMYVDEHRQGFNVRPGGVPPLDLALEAARQAVTLDPDSAFTHRRLADVFMSRGVMALARQHIMQALKLNPNNAEVLADVGWIIKNLGEWDEAVRYTRKAIALNPGHPPWYLETLFLYHYRNKDCERARSAARAHFRNSDGALLPHVLLVASAVLCGKAGTAERNIRILNSNYPGFLNLPRKTFRELAIPEELHNRLVGDLRKAGVKFTLKGS